MTYYRTLLVAGAVVLGATSAYASGGKAGISNRDDIRVNHEAQPAPMFEGRAATREPAPYAYEPGSTSEGVPVDVRKRDITTEGNDNR